MIDQILFRTLVGPNNLPFSITCLQSVLNNSVNPIRLEIFDDGNLKTEHIHLLQSSLPNSIVIPKADRDMMILEKLKNYPKCLYFRNSNVLAYKLFDTILFNDRNFYFVDTDVIFYRKFKLPPFPEEAIFMVDYTDSYNFRPVHFFNINTPVFPRSNTGFMFFPAKKYDLDYIEKTLQNATLYNNVMHPWAEQTMWSFLAAKYDKVNIFDPLQVVIASAKMKVSESTIAIHFIKPFRHTIDKFKFLEKTQDTYTEIKLIETSEKLSFLVFTTRWLTRKFLAALKKVGLLKRTERF
jgi:hypothetical protein